MNSSVGKSDSSRMITILIGLILIALAYWVLTNLGLPDMIVKIGTVLLVVFVVLWLINFLAPGSVPLNLR